MTKLKKLAIAVAASAGVLAAVPVGAVVIDGVSFNAGSQFVTTKLWESVLLNSLDTLVGVGIVQSIDCGGCGGTTWAAGDNNTQLTYHFGGYSVAKWYDKDGGAHLSGDEGTVVGKMFTDAVKIDFTGGFVNLYTDRVVGGVSLLNPSANPTAVNPVLMAADIIKATDSNLWLAYTGVTTTDVSGRVGTLFADTNTLNSVHAGGAGYGYLDVVGGGLGGLAAGNFDTDSWTIGPVIADARMDSSFSNTVSGAWPLSGTAALKTEAIPEPGSLALIGLGLTGLGITYRRKSAKKA